VLLNRPGLEEAIKRLLSQELNGRRQDQHDPESIRHKLLRKRKQLMVLADGVSVDACRRM
jgi:hypothetical protein